MEIFLSHAAADRALVARIKSRLEALGVRTYAAEHDGRAGENLHDKVTAALRRCDLMVVLLTQTGHASRYVHQEIGFAKRDGKLIIPMVAQDVAHSGSLGMLEGIEYIVMDEVDPADALHSLSRRIEDIIHARAHAQRQRQRDQELRTAALALIVIGIILLAMRE